MDERALETVDRKTDLLKRPIIHLLIIMVVGFLAYSNTFYGPMQWDGVAQITTNPLMKAIGNFMPGAQGYEANPRRFIGYLSFALNYRFGGASIVGYHVVNLIIHLVNALLVYFLVILTFRTPIMRRTSNDSPVPAVIAIMSALLFVAHPLQTMAVTYIVQRFTSLATLFYLLSLVIYIKGRLATQDPEIKNLDMEGKGRSFRKKHSIASIAFYIVSFISAGLAMTTKEIAFTLPLVISLYEFTFFKISFRKILLFLLPILLFLIVVSLGVMHSDKSLGEVLADLSAQTRLQTNMSRWDYFVTEMRVMVTYLRLLVAPMNQNIDYEYPLYHSLLTPPVFISFIFLLSLFGLGGCLLYISWARKSVPPPSAPYHRFIGFGILWFFITLSIESSVIPIRDVIFEHRVYLPSVGFFTATSTGILMLAQKFKMQKAAIAILCFAVLTLSVATFARNYTWNNRIRLWTDTVKKSPDKVRVRYNLAQAYFDEGLGAESLNEYQLAVKLDPGNAEAHYNLGIALFRQDRQDDAAREFQTALAIMPNYADAHDNLGTVYTKEGRLNDAVREYAAAISIMPDHGKAHYNLGSTLSDMGRYDDAVRELQTAASLMPDNADVLNNIGNTYLKLNRLDDAARAFQTALRIEPDIAEPHFNLGIVHMLEGRTDEAINDFQAAVNIDPNEADAHNNLGAAYLQKGRIEDAIRQFQITLNLKPQDAEARRNLEILSRTVKGGVSGK